MRIEARPIISILVFIVLTTAMKVEAQIVEPDVKKWSAADCVWLHREVLEGCKKLDPPCSNLVDDMSMAIQRGMIALEPVMTVRNRREFDSICYRICTDKSVPSYTKFNKEFCSTVPRMTPAVRPDRERPTSVPQ